MSRTASCEEQPVLEVLAPAGSPEAFAAALGSGADAVYLGLADGFNARARSTAFERAMLPELVRRAHRAGARLHLTLNTLVFEQELEQVSRLLVEVAQAGVDAIIVQDPAVALMAQALCPSLRIHASTQMTISSVEGARFAATLGVQRVVLPRELSLKEIARFTEHCPLEAEVFAHGALCMSWSGQCLTSEAFSDRSANRGQCSQACRMPYDLIVDGERRDLGAVRYLLSPQDLDAHGEIPELIAAGVRSVKIEGRYKNAAYVATTVAALRAACQAPVGPKTSAEVAHKALLTQLTYSRGGSPGFLRGDDHQSLVVGTTPKHRGVPLGRVRVVRGQQVRLEVEAPEVMKGLLRPGMGVVFEVGDPERDEAPGGAIFEVCWEQDWVWLGFGSPGPNLSRIAPGAVVRLTGDPQLARQTQRLTQTEPEGRIALRIKVRGRESEPLCLAAQGMAAGRLLTAQVASDVCLQEARGRGLAKPLLSDKLGALGGTPFCLHELETTGLGPGLHLAVSELKRLRRALVESLTEQLDLAEHAIVAPQPTVAGLRAKLAEGQQPLAAAPYLVPLCRTQAQLDAVIASGACAEVELDFMELVGLRVAVEQAREAGLRVTLATVRVQKAGEEGYDKRLRALAPDAVLVRHWGGLMSFADQAMEESSQGLEVHGDFSLNVTNSLTGRHLLRLGLQTVTAAHDLDRGQLLDFIANMPRGRVAITVHHHIATFHNSHCVYAHLLSAGADYRTCGRPCEEHRVALRDFAGNEHPVVVDVGCRNTVFNALAQSAAPLVPNLLAQGVQRLRVEFVWESAEEVLRTLRAYQGLLSGELSPKAVLREVAVHERYGLTPLRT